MIVRDARADDPAPRDLRASDADRERVAELLREAAGDGRLTLEEHGERLERAYAARTLGELVELTRDLAHPEQASGSGVIDVDQRPLIAIFRSDHRGGRWVVPARQPSLAVCGTIKLDLREALLQRRHVVIQAAAVVGSVEILVPEGVEVRMSGPAIFGRKSNHARWTAGTHPPVVEVRAFALLGLVNVKTPRRRRWFRGRA